MDLTDIEYLQFKNDAEISKLNRVFEIYAFVFFYAVETGTDNYDLLNELIMQYCNVYSLHCKTSDDLWKQFEAIQREEYNLHSHMDIW